MGVHGSYEKHEKDKLCAKRYTKAINRLDDLSRFGSNKEVFDKWVDVSTHQQTEDTVRKLILTDPFSICLSFLCHYQTFSEEFIEELYWLSTRLFDYRTYNKDLISLLIQFTDDIPREERIKVLTKIEKKEYVSEKAKKYVVLRNYNLGEKTLIEALIEAFSNDRGPDRLDWSELNNWDLSKKFREKYSAEFEKARFIVDSSYDEDGSYLPSSANLY